MATIVQPPFWVPRPADTPVWTGQPIGSAIIPFFTQTKVFGAGGQVPIKFWRYDIELGERQWEGKPLPSTILASGLSPGQIKPRWLWKFELDNPPIWPGAPTASILLADLLTAQGQVKPRWLWNFGYDDPSAWSGAPTRNAQLTPSLGPAFPRKSWAFDQFDDSSVWSGAPLKSGVLSDLLTIGGQTPPRLSWNFGTDDSPVWQFIGQINQSLLAALTVSSPFVNPPWKFGGDDPSIWTGAPVKSAVLAELLTAQGQAPPRLPWNFTLNDPPPWFGKPTSNPQLLPFLGSAFPRKSWAFDLLDDSSVWTGAPVKSALLADLLTSSGQTYPRVPWNFGLNEPPSWYGQPLPNQERNLLLLTTVVSSPFVNAQFSFGVNSIGIDYSAFWTGGPLPAYTMSIPPPSSVTEVHNFPFIANVGTLMQRW